MSARRVTLEPSVDRFRAVGQLVLLVAMLRVVTALTMPPIGEPLHPDQLLASTLLLGGHSALYFFGDPFRKRSGLVAYFGMQGTLIMAIGLFSLSLSLWLCVALT